MPFPHGHTTRRGRYLYCRQLYLERTFQKRWKYYKWQSNPTTPMRVRLYRKYSPIRGAKLRLDLAHPKTPAPYARTSLDPTSVPWTITPAAYRRPPTARIDFDAFRPHAPKWHHNAGELVKLHARSSKTTKRKPRDGRNTAFNRRVTGCNWHYFMQGYFPDDDVLGRRPNMTDAANGHPPGATAWPVPLGYQAV